MKLPIIMYHGVNSEKYPHVYKNDHIWTIELEQFKRHLELIHLAGCKVVLLKDLPKEHLDNKQKLIVLTFDDGHESNYWNALPALNAYGYKAEFFITAGLINKNGYMSESQLKKLKEEGMSIQSHAYHHRFMPLLDDKKLMFELQESKKKISEIISDDVRYFSYPGGRYDERTEMAARDNGYQGTCTSEVGYNIVGDCLYALKRFHFIVGMKDNYFKAIIGQNSLYFSLRRCKRLLNRIF